MNDFQKEFFDNLDNEEYNKFKYSDKNRESFYQEGWLDEKKSEKEMKKRILYSLYSKKSIKQDEDKNKKNNFFNHKTNFIKLLKEFESK